jgi:type I restriction enzyme S subunit
LIFGTGGNASIHFCDNTFSVSTDCLVAFAKDETKVYLKYIFFFLSGNINLLEEGFKGAGLKHISKGYINEIRIPLPPLATQKRIAEILDAADALRRKDQELLKKYEELAQAIFIDMFGDPVKNEKGWEIRKLGELFSASVKCGPFGSALKKEEYTFHGIPVWIMDNIQDYAFNQNGCLYISESKYKDLKSYSVTNGDVIISRAGTVGKMCVVNSEFTNSIISTNLIKISLEGSLLNPYFFVTLMKYFGKKIGRLRTGSENGFTHMNTGVLAGLEFPLPGIKRQNEFISVLESISIQTGSLHYKPERLFNSLIQKAFKGELVT